MPNWTACPLGQVPPDAGLVFGSDVGMGAGPGAQWLLSPPVVVDRPAVTVGGNVVTSAAVGAVMTCTHGNWGGSPTTYAYQWKSGTTNVGTNANTYTAVAGDAGKTIRCVVTATNAAGSTAAPPSNGVAIA